ncbi:MAG: extracellular solute-binding protein [Candidatus Nanopelagicaceae bacterium]|nr:extracellular solute-binding protein [Candidatus Nanopelagicaceae bacterium]
MKNKKITAISSVLAIIALAGTIVSTTSASASSTKKITLNYWTHVNPPTQAVEKKLIAQYVNRNPNVKINYLPVDFGSLPAKLNSSIAGGGGPDLFNYFQSYAPGLATKGYLAPVDFKAFGVSNKAKFGARYTKPIADGYTWAGKVIGVPHEVSAFQFWINNDQFKVAGLDPVANFPKTWADVATYGSRIQNAVGGSKEGIALSLNSTVRDSLVFDSWARQAGNGLFSNDGKTSYVNSPAAVRALQTWGDLVNVSKINDPSLGPTASTNAEDLFGSGTAAMVNVGGSWFQPTLAQTYPSIKYTVGQLPNFGINNIGADLYGFGLYVPITSKQKTEAWKFARFLADNAGSYFTGAGVWLGDNKTLSSGATAKVANWSVFAQGFKRGYFLAQLVNYSQISQILEDAIQRVVINGVSAKDSLTQAQTQIGPLLNK